MRRLATAVLAACLLALVPVVAHAQGADAVGWWSAFSGLPAAPDVGATDLLLQGGDPLRLLPNTGVVDQSPAPSAFAALRFHVLPGSAVGALQLSVAMGGQAMDVRAYATLSAWKAVQNGALAGAPEPDLARYSQGRLVGDDLVFPDIGRLVTDAGELSVVLYPGPADRVVVHAPSPAALSVTALSAPPEPDPVREAPEALPPVLPRVDPPVLQPVATAPLAAVPLPQAAPGPVALAPATPVAGRHTGVTRLVSDDSRSRFVVLAEALLVLVFFGLLGQGPMALLAREQTEVEVARGVGRFHAVRAGRAPRL